MKLFGRNEYVCEKNIEALKSNIPGFIILDQKSVCKKIIRARNVIWLDTCFITKIEFLPDRWKIFQAYEKMANGKSERDIVFVITELVLYELMDSDINVVHEKQVTFFTQMHEYGFCILLLNEETIHKNLELFLISPTWNGISFFLLFFVQTWHI